MSILEIIAHTTNLNWRPAALTHDLSGITIVTAAHPQDAANAVTPANGDITLASRLPRQIASPPQSPYIPAGGRQLKTKRIEHLFYTQPLGLEIRANSDYSIPPMATAAGFADISRPARREHHINITRKRGPVRAAGGRYASRDIVGRRARRPYRLQASV